MSNLSITTALCTWNRSKYLRDTLTSLQEMEVPADIEWEVLVINNNCTDDTDTVIASFANTLPIRSLRESRQGASHARNCAVDAALGNYILWTDDDVIVSPGWLAAYVDAFRTWPDAAIFGGPIIPKFEGQPPAWLLMALQDGIIADAFGTRDFGDEPFKLKGNKILYGANFAVRMQEQRQFSFDPRLGRRKHDNIRGGETSSIIKIIDSGAKGRWVPNAPVHHVIPEDQQTVASLRYYFVGGGRTYVRENPAHHANSFLGVPPRLWRATVTSQLKFYLKRPFVSPKVWCRELRRSSNLWGQLLEYRAARRRG